MLKTPVPSTTCGDGQGVKIRPFFLMLFFVVVVVSPWQQEGKTNIKRQKLKISKKDKDHAT